MNALSLATVGTVLLIAVPAVATTQRPSRPAPAPAPSAPPAARPAPAPAPSAPRGGSTPAPRGRTGGEDGPTSRGGGAPPPRTGDGGAKPKSGKDEARPPEDVAAEYFRTADYDGNGWITYTEAQASLNVDRTSWKVYDTDNDGRISPEEFTKRYLLLVSRGGAFSPPVALVDPEKVQPRTAEEILAAFDDDQDGALDLREIGRTLKEYGVNGLDPAKVLDSFDDNGSTRFELSELPPFVEVLMPSTGGRRGAKAASLEELFDRYEEREVERDTTPQPTRIVGPVSTFRRLDADGSGGITLDDLDYLQRPLHIEVRAGAVIASLDKDGDGVVSQEEFRASMR